MIKLEKSIYTQLALPILAVLIGAGLLWRFSVVPLARMSKEYQTNRIVLAEVEQKTGLRSKLDKEFKRVEESALQIQNSLLRADAILVFIEALESAASKTGNTYEINVVQELRDESGNLTAINFIMELEGSFSSLSKFLRELKPMEYLMNFIQVSVVGNTSGGLSTKATLQVYIQ